MKKKIFSALIRNNNTFKWPHIEAICEEIKLNGYSILPNFANKNEIKNLRAEIDSLEKKEIVDFGSKNLKKINDLGVIRSPYLVSKIIAKKIFSKSVLKVCKYFFKNNFILNVNRAVVNKKNFLHPATLWHREPPYQNFTTNNPVALTFIHCIDDNKKKNGGIKILKGSHKWATFPSLSFAEKNYIIPDIKSGDILVFDSAMFHSGSKNFSGVRRSLVTIFTLPLFKQQTDITKQIDFRDKHKYLRNIDNKEFLFGFTTNPFTSDKEYRLNKLKKGLHIK